MKHFRTPTSSTMTDEVLCSGINFQTCNYGHLYRIEIMARVGLSQGKTNPASLGLYSLGNTVVSNLKRGCVRLGGVQ